MLNWFSLGQICFKFLEVFFLPKSMVWECEKLPPGLAPPTIRILPFPSSPDGINVQVWPTLTPGALPLGIKEYLLTAKQFQQDEKKLASYITCAINWSEFTYHIPSLGLSRGSSTGRNSITVKDIIYTLIWYYYFFHTSLVGDQFLT